MYALNLNEDKRILSATFDEFAPPELPRVEELPEGDISDYLFKNNNYIYEPLPEPPEPEVGPDINKLRADIDFVAMMTDVDLDD